jgi:hypothetical protein
VPHGGESGDEAHQREDVGEPVHDPEEPSQQCLDEPRRAAVLPHRPDAGDQLPGCPAGERLEHHEQAGVETPEHDARRSVPAVVEVHAVIDVGGVEAEASLLVEVGVAELLSVDVERIDLEVLELRCEHEDGRDHHEQRIDHDSEDPPPEHRGGIGGRQGVRHPAVLLHLVIDRREATGSLRPWPPPPIQRCSTRS